MKRRQGTGGAVTHSEVFFDLGHQGRVDHPRREVQQEDGRQQQDRADTADERPPVLRVPMAGCCLIGVFFHGWKRCFLFRTRAQSRPRRLIPLTPYRIRHCFSRVSKAPKFHITQPYLFQQLFSKTSKVSPDFLSCSCHKSLNALFLHLFYPFWGYCFSKKVYYFVSLIWSRSFGLERKELRQAISKTSRMPLDLQNCQIIMHSFT